MPPSALTANLIFIKKMELQAQRKKNPSG